MPVLILLERFIEKIRLKFFNLRSLYLFNKRGKMIVIFKGLDKLLGIESIDGMVL